MLNVIRMEETKMELPKHLEFAIKHEERCIALREKQIESYKKKIKLLKTGLSYKVVNEQVKPVLANVSFKSGEYNRLKIISQKKT